MDTIGWIVLAGVALLALRGIAGSAASNIGSTEAGTGARLFDSTVRNSIPVGGAVHAIKQPNGSYYCPIGTKLWKDIHTGQYACVEPSNLIGVPNSVNVGPVAPGSQLTLPPGPGQIAGVGAPITGPVQSESSAEAGVVAQAAAGTFVGPLSPSEQAALQSEAPVLDVINSPPADLTALLNPLGPSPSPPAPIDVQATLTFPSDASNVPAAGTDASQTDAFGSAFIL